MKLHIVIYTMGTILLMVKGSNGSRMARIIEAIRAKFPAAAGETVE